MGGESLYVRRTQRWSGMIGYDSIDVPGSGSELQRNSPAKAESQHPEIRRPDEGLAAQVVQSRKHVEEHVILVMAHARRGNLRVGPGAVGNYVIQVGGQADEPRKRQRGAGVGDIFLGDPVARDHDHTGVNTIGEGPCEITV